MFTQDGGRATRSRKKPTYPQGPLSNVQVNHLFWESYEGTNRKSSIEFVITLSAAHISQRAASKKAQKEKNMLTVAPRDTSTSTLSETSTIVSLRRDSLWSSVMFVEEGE